MKRFYVQAILFSFFLMSCVVQPIQTQSGDPVLVVTTKNTEDQINIQYQASAALIDVTSPGGLGSAAFTLESGSMPEEILLRLHLKALEKFQIKSGETGITASMPSSDPAGIPHQTVSTPESELSIQPTDPLWLKIEIISPQAQKGMPLEEGYFEITVPKDFIRKIRDTFRIEWLDFYR